MNQAHGKGRCAFREIMQPRFAATWSDARDAPESLRRALPSAERARWSDRLLAAFIMLYGRARVSLFGRS
jgi:hypothetical protein